MYLLRRNASSRALKNSAMRVTRASREPQALASRHGETGWVLYLPGYGYGKLVVPLDISRFGRVKRHTHFEGGSGYAAKQDHIVLPEMWLCPGRHVGGARCVRRSSYPRI